MPVRTEQQPKFSRAGLETLGRQAAENYGDDAAGFFADLAAGKTVAQAYATAQRYGVGDTVIDWLRGFGNAVGEPKKVATSVLAQLDAALKKKARELNFEIFSNEPSPRTLDRDIKLVMETIGRELGVSIAFSRVPKSTMRGAITGPAPSLEFTRTPRDLSGASTYRVELDGNKILNGELSLLAPNARSHIDPASPRVVAQRLYQMVKAG